MSLFGDSRYRWRETYFVLFEESKRPALEQIQQLLGTLAGRYQVTGVASDEQGGVESLTILAPEDYAALDVSYVSGEEVIEQAVDLLEDLKPADDAEREKCARLARANARLDVMHFEQLAEEDDEEPEEMLDPSALLVVLEKLVELTGGVAYDPQAGALL